MINFFEPLPEDKHYHYYVFAAPPEKPKYSLDDIESELAFREGEFWIGIVNSFDREFYNDWPLPDGRFEGLGHHIDVGNIRVKVAWDESGSKIAVYQTDGGNDLVQGVWETKKSDLRKLFKGQDVDLENLAENLQMISVMVSDLAVSWLLKAGLPEKMEVAEMLHKYYSKIVDFVKDVSNQQEG